MMPFVLIATMMVVQFGLAYYAQQVMSGATQDGAAAGARSGGSASAGEALAESLIDQGAGQLLSSSDAVGTSDGSLVTVTAQGKVFKVFPMFPTITVRATGSASVEEFTPEGGT